MKLFSVLLSLLFCLNNYQAFSTSSFLHKVPFDSSKTKRQPFSPYVGLTGNVGSAAYVAYDNIITISHPYSVYNYSNGTTDHTVYYSQLRTIGSKTPMQFIIGGGIDAAFHRKGFAELQMNSWAPGTGNNINCISIGGGFTLLPKGKKFSLRIGVNYFRLKRSAGIGSIDNYNKDVTIQNTSFDRQFYEEREVVRKKDTVTVYDVYNANYITVSHNEVYQGVQPKLVLSYGEETSPLILRLHLGWNVPLHTSINLKYIQHGLYSYTMDYVPSLQAGSQRLRMRSSSPYVTYQSNGPQPSYTAGFFFKVEIGIRLISDK